MISATARLKQKAIETGFDDMRIIPYQRLEKDLTRLETWLQNKYHASMAYMESKPEKRADPRMHIETCESVIILCKNYRKDITPTEFRIAQYALERDYHHSLAEKLNELSSFIQNIYPHAKVAPFCDAHPVLERAFARESGLGFIGKNTLLIHKKLGSFIFLCGLFTNIRFDTDVMTPQGNCGTCTACLDACPTQALTEPFNLDASKCISFLTIENKQDIPENLVPQIGNWVFGCDICQDVCPHNASPVKMKQTVASSHDIQTDNLLKTLMHSASNKGFQRQFRNFAVSRAGRKGLIRNFCVSISNSRQPQRWSHFLHHFKDDPHPFIRSQARNALSRIQKQSISPKTQS